MVGAWSLFRLLLVFIIFNLPFLRLEAGLVGSRVRLALRRLLFYQLVKLSLNGDFTISEIKMMPMWCINQ